MSDNPGMSFHDAAVYGLEFSRRIEDVCEKLQLSASLRRGRPVVHDIEMVVVPRLGPGTQMTVDGSYRRENLLHRRMLSLLNNRGILHREKDQFGERYYKFAVNINGRTVPIDLFAVLPPAQWGTQLLISTGCAEFSHWIISQRISQGYRFKDGHLKYMGRTIDTPTEESVFEVLRIQYVQPDRRNLEADGRPMWE